MGLVMKLRLVKFAEYRGPEQTRSYSDDRHELEYIESARAIRIRARAGDQAWWYADQTGAVWHPLAEPAPIVPHGADACNTCGAAKHGPLVATKDNPDPCPADVATTSTTVGVKAADIPRVARELAWREQQEAGTNGRPAAPPTGPAAPSTKRQKR